ncbi:hypothetical protein RIF29_14744 [Crotalaria pallida]|uniref:Uncharacterized protein n=1 Tax=Crotalaria pallida TaxID=3830 RepID=A0AAN9IE11_CROPI
MGILKEMRYLVVDTLWYKDGKEIKELVDDNGASEMEEISRTRGIVNLYVLHHVSMLEELVMLPPIEGLIEVTSVKDGVPFVVLDEEDESIQNVVLVRVSVIRLVKGDECDTGGEGAKDVEKVVQVRVGLKVLRMWCR